jgi:hypothetical protein
MTETKVLWTQEAGQEAPKLDKDRQAEIMVVLELKIRSNLFVNCSSRKKERD